MAEIVANKYTPKDFKSDQEVRWCPGCGDHAVLSSVQRALAELGIPKRNLHLFPGSDAHQGFPYYMDTYGFHSIHGRASAIASGVKIANPELSVWQITGDGDALAIGGNHFIHVIRRNIDINIILFNNEIYGLTKGQYSPTSIKDLLQKLHLSELLKNHFQLENLLLEQKANFLPVQLIQISPFQPRSIQKQQKHKGTSVVEVLQNCVIFNDGIHDVVADKEVRDDRTIILKHGQPMIFGKDNDKGLILEGLKLKVVNTRRKWNH